MIEPTIRGDVPPTAVACAPSRRGIRWARRLASWAVVSLLVVGPWPVEDSRGVGSGVHRGNLARLESLPIAGATGPVRVGVAEVDLTPTTPRPLAGFIGQVSTPFVGVDTPCMARALTIESASGAVTVLTADLLLINARLARAVVERAGLQPDQVVFTASHTHGGPGGWGDHPLEMLVAGAYDPAFFDWLAARLAGAIRESRARPVPAEVGFVSTTTHARQTNRVEPGSPTHDALSALVFRPAGSSGTPAPSPLAILVVFGAHATVSHPVPPRLGADYPSALARELRRTTGAGAVLFAAGAVGDASPARPKAPSQRQSAEVLGVALAGDLLAALPSADFRPEVVVAGLRLDVDLPPVRLPFLVPWMRFSPAATWWVADRRTHLQALRIGPAVLVGFPGDYSGHLATRLGAMTRPTGLATVATSFDGDFRGYLTSEEVHRRRPCYETRWMSFYGPGLGDDLTDLARRMVERLAGVGPVTAVGPATGDVPYRAILAVLLLAAWGLAGRELIEAGRGSGLMTRGMLGLAALSVAGFLVAPGLVDWDGVGLSAWLRLAGLPVGVLGLWMTRTGRGRGGLLFGVGCFLLSSGWLVALAALRSAVAGDVTSRNRPRSRTTAPGPCRTGRKASDRDSLRVPA